MANNEQIIWSYFEDKGFSKYGIAGLMGNLYAESGLYPQNLQNTYNSLLGFTDAEYTKAVDNGTYTNFVNDAAGYGLAQWTYWSRKKNLLNFAKEKNKSIGDLNLQLDFLYKELKENFNSVFNTLKTAKSVLEASNVVLFKFENPAVQNTSVQNQRASYGQKYYDQFVKGTITKEEISTMGKTISTGFLTNIINGIKIDSSKKCHADNYNNSASRKIDYVVMHYTGNSQDTAWANANYFQSPNRGASAHFFVDDDSIYQSIELRDIAWHCGANTYYHNYCRNSNSIGIEMCCTAGNYKISRTTIKNAAHLCAHLCKLLGISASQVDTYVLRHYDVTHKQCPAQMSNSANDPDWTSFKKQVKEILGGKTTTTTTTKPAVNTTPKQELYRVRKSWDDAKSQIGAFANLEGAKKVCKNGYKVFDSNGKVVYEPKAETKPSTSTATEHKNKIELNNIPLYVSSDAREEKKKITGTYYIHSNEVVNNKIKITNKIENIGKSGQVTGWIKVSDAKLTQQKEAFKAYNAVVTADLLNVRIGAGMNYNVSSQLKQNTKIKISKEQGNWGYISGKGWVCLDYIKKV